MTPGPPSRPDMACGSVFASDPGLTPGRDLTSGADLHPDLAAKPLARSSYRPTGEVHEAVRFLQAEHEAVLRGVHQQMARLQQRCEELEFEAHLRPLTVDAEAWRRRVADASRRAEEGASRAARLERQVAAAEEQLEQHRWREATLRQQVEAGEQRAADLRAEVTRLRAQVRDLRVYSTALRTSGGSARTPTTPTPRGAARVLRPPSRTSLGSQESLEGGGGPRSLGSEDGEAGGWWREARLGGSAGGRGARGGATPSLPRTPAASLPPSLPSPPPSLPPLASLPPARPSSGAVVLPPIEAGRGGVGRHVRRQIRLASAPAPAAGPTPGTRPDAVPQREPA